MRPELPHILRSYAADLDAAGPQFATMSAVLREAADALNPPVARVCPVPASVPVLDDDGIPGFRVCLTCED
jgi:hypothetical protein